VDGLESLTAVQSIVIAANATLLDVDGLSGLDNAVSFTISNNVGMTIARVTGLSFLRGELTIAANPSLEQVSFPVLERVGGGLTVASNESLVAADFSSLLSVAESLIVSQNPELDTLTIENLSSVSAILINDNPKLPQCVVDAIDADLMACESCQGNDESTSCD
jgi:hypothetical protein